MMIMLPPEIQIDLNTHTYGAIYNPVYVHMYVEN